MGTFKFICSVLLFAIILPLAGKAQGDAATPLHFEVNRVYPYIYTTPAQLPHIQTLAELNPHYKPAWVRAYYSVEVSGSKGGKMIQAISPNDQLTKAQKALIASADPGTALNVRIHYLPENTLVHNEAKVMEFSFTLEPGQPVTYPGGVAKLNAYLAANAIGSIPPVTFTGYDLAAVKFTVASSGEIVDVELFNSAQRPVVESRLLKAIQHMPCWHPATYADGTTVAQEFVLTVGNMENCMVQLLNIESKQ